MTQIDEPNLDEQIELMKAEFYASDLSPKSFDLTIGIRTKMLVATQIQEAYRKGHNDNARDCYCDSAKVIESLIPHKHLMDDGKSHAYNHKTKGR